MSVVRFKQIAAGRKGSSGKSDSSYVVVWNAIVDDPRDGPLTIGNYHPGGPPSANAPLRFQPYIGYEQTDDPRAVCTDLQVEQDGEEWRKWRVTATFSSESGGASQTPTEPETDPVAFWIETEFGEEETTETWDGKEIKNSAGQLIAGLRKPCFRETWVWEKNYISLNRSNWLAYQNTVNSSAFYEIEAKKGLLHIIVPKASFRGGVQYWRVQFRVQINKDKWTVEPCDRGTAVKNADGKLEQPVDPITGQKIDGEVYLKSDGTMLDPNEDDIRYLPAKDLLEPKDFYALGFAT